MSLDFDRCQFLVGDFDPRLIAIGIQLRLDSQTGLWLRTADQVDDDGTAEQRLAAPVFRDVAEHPMLNLVPLARPGRKMAHGDPQADLVRQLLQGYLPQPRSATVAAP